MTYVIIVLLLLVIVYLLRRKRPVEIQYVPYAATREIVVTKEVEKPVFQLPLFPVEVLAPENNVGKYLIYRPDHTYVGEREEGHPDLETAENEGLLVVRCN